MPPYWKVCNYDSVFWSRCDSDFYSRPSRRFDVTTSYRYGFRLAMKLRRFLVVQSTKCEAQLKRVRTLDTVFNKKCFVWLCSLEKGMHSWHPFNKRCLLNDAHMRYFPSWCSDKMRSSIGKDARLSTLFNEKRLLIKPCSYAMLSVVYSLFHQFSALFCALLVVPIEMWSARATITLDESRRDFLMFFFLFFLLFFFLLFFFSADHLKYVRQCFHGTYVCTYQT